MRMIDHLKFADALGYVLGTAHRGSRPHRTKDWRNPNDPAQAARIAQAEAKRLAKANKLRRNAVTAALNNHAHTHASNPNVLNPFHVNR